MKLEWFRKACAFISAGLLHNYNFMQLVPVQKHRCIGLWSETRSLESFIKTAMFPSNAKNIDMIEKPRLPSNEQPIITNGMIVKRYPFAVLNNRLYPSTTIIKTIFANRNEGFCGFCTIARSHNQPHINFPFMCSMKSKISLCPLNWFRLRNFNEHPSNPALHISKHKIKQ